MSTGRAGKPIDSKQRAWSVLGVALLAIMFTTPGRVGAETDAHQVWVAKAVSVQGDVMVRRKDSAGWQPIELDERFVAGDTIKVGPYSRAAFVLRNESTVRVDQETTLVFVGEEPERSFLIEMVNGALHFFSRVHRRLRLITPFVNGTVEGTEFVARVNGRQTIVTLLEGRIHLFNAQGRVTLTQNQTVVARADHAPIISTRVRPRDAVQWALFYPTIIDTTPEDFDCDAEWCGAMQRSVAAWRRGDVREAFNALAAVPAGVDDARLLLYRATMDLSVGRVEAAESTLEKIKTADARWSDALALRAIVAVAQNDKATAKQLIDQAQSHPQTSGSVDLAHAYVQQAFFNLTSARKHVQAATAKEPTNALAWARLSELHLSLGDRQQALAAARRAATLQPQLARTQTVLGFAYLAQMNTTLARAAFVQAIARDSADPLPRLGLGLAKIRDGQLTAGRSEIEIAASLDPGDALIRSYLGKAYYEEKRDEPAQEQLAAAKQLDPADPTPWYYDAIRKQTLNRPVEALHDLQQSMSLNDNRAVYRSRLLLDEDLAARSASIGRIYRDLGFEQLALVEGWKSVNTDPGNYSAHRFLADSYSALPRHEIARVSELLQAQMLQPININPIQPSLAETNQFILAGAEPSAPAFNEFGPLFQRNRAALQASGVVGNNSTWGDEAVVSGLYNRYSLSLGQFHYETNGFRENNDQTSNLYNGFAQISLTPETSLLAEYRSSDEANGDLPLRFDPENVDRFYRQDVDRQSMRLGGRYSPNPNNDLIGTIIFSALDGVDQSTIPAFDLSYAFEEEQDGLMAEVQHLFHSPMINLVSGIGYFHSESDALDTITGFPPDRYTNRVDHTTPYLYSQIHLPHALAWTIGASMDFFETRGADREQFNPKLGVIWSLTQTTTLRAAAFRTFKRNLIADQTLEPTQVAGFNQFYDDGNQTDAWRYGAAIDQTLGQDLFAGVEYAERDLEITYQDFNLEYQTVGWEENAGRAYLFWTPLSWMSTSIEYGYSRFERDREFVGSEEFVTLSTHTFPIGVNVYHPRGAYFRFKATYVDQEGEFGDPRFGTTETDGDAFWVVDAAIGYRLPQRYGIISLEANNLFDRRFRFQDTDPSNPTILPEQAIWAKITLAF